MATDITLLYGIGYGRGDCSDWAEYDVTLDGDAEAAYLEEMQKPVEDRHFRYHEAMRQMIQQAEREIKAEIKETMTFDNYIQSFPDPDDRVRREDIDEIAEVYDALYDYLHIYELSEEEQDEWTPDDVDDDDLPTYNELGIDPPNAFDEGYTLYIRFADEIE